MKIGPVMARTTVLEAKTKLKSPCDILKIINNYVLLNNFEILKARIKEFGCVAAGPTTSLGCCQEMQVNGETEGIIF